METFFIPAAFTTVASGSHGLNRPKSWPPAHNFDNLTLMTPRCDVMIPENSWVALELAPGRFWGFSIISFVLNVECPSGERVMGKVADKDIEIFQNGTSLRKLGKEIMSSYASTEAQRGKDPTDYDITFHPLKSWSFMEDELKAGNVEEVWAAAGQCTHVMQATAGGWKGWHIPVALSCCPRKVVTPIMKGM